MQYPSDWVVSFAVESPAGFLVHRQHEFTVKAEPSHWYLFNRYVENGKGSYWIDAWDVKSGAFATFVPQEVTKIRVAGLRPKR
jgi:hypothetical protein